MSKKFAKLPMAVDFIEASGYKVLELCSKDNTPYITIEIDRHIYKTELWFNDFFISVDLTEAELFEPSDWQNWQKFILNSLSGNDKNNYVAILDHKRNQELLSISDYYEKLFKDHPEKSLTLMETKQKEIAGVQRYYSFINQYKNNKKSNKNHSSNFNHDKKKKHKNKLTSYGDSYHPETIEHEN